MNLVLLLKLISIVQSFNMITLSAMGRSRSKPLLCDWQPKTWGKVKKELKANFFDPRRQTKFLLVNKHVNNQLIQLDDFSTLNSSMYDETLPTKFIIHGFRSSDKSRMITDLAAAYVQNHNVNVIKGKVSDIQGFLELPIKVPKFFELFFVSVGWGDGSKTLCYSWATQRGVNVGTILAEFLDFLLGDDPLIWKKLTLVGHSIGAHIAGVAGKKVKKGKVGTIIGLDPALPLYDNVNDDFRLIESDANYVEVIHTNINHFGMATHIGNIDFYLNGGKNQPGCHSSSCSHSRAADLFKESLEPGNRFSSTRCENNDKNIVWMGGEPGNIEKNVSGIYCLNTTEKYPFGIGKLGNIR